MQEKTPSQSEIAPKNKPQNVNNVSTLDPIMLLDLIDDFKKSLITPLGYQVFIDCLKQALKYRAHSIINYLSKCELSKVDGDKSAITRYIPYRLAKEFFNLIYLEHAQYFRSDDKKELRALFYEKLRITKNREPLIAAISGDVSKLKAITNIPERPNAEFSEFILYAAANDHAEVVRYLHEHNHNPHDTDVHKNAMVAAIVQNATRVFDYLVQTEFDPNAYLCGNFWKCPFPEDYTSLLRLTVRYQRPQQFEQLVKKGATVTEDIFRLAILLGNESIIDCCLEKISPPADSLTIAIKSGNRSLTSSLYYNGFAFCLNTFDLAGFTPLCYAVIYNKLDIVKELVSLGADIMAVNTAGTNAILIAADLNHIEILQYLLEHLKSNTTTEKFSDFLNNSICTNPKHKAYNNILFEIAINLTRPWHSLRDPSSKDFATKKCIIDLLIAHGARLFIKNSNKLLPSFRIVQTNYPNDAIVYFHFLAAQQLIKMKKLRLEHLILIVQLEKFHNEINICKEFQPDLAALSRLRMHLTAFGSYTKKGSLENLAEIIVTFFPNAPNILATHIETLINHDNSTSANKLSKIIESLLTLPNVLKYYICTTLADRLYTKAIKSQKPNPITFAIAQHLYNATCTPNNTAIEEKIKACTERTGGFSLDVCAPSKEQQTYLTNKLIDLAIDFNNVKILNALLDYSFSRTMTSWPMKDFKKLYNASCSNLNFFSDLIHEASSKIFDMINLRLLLMANHDNQTPKLLGTYLRELSGKMPRRLLILAHILTFFPTSIAQPVAIRNIFNKALLELSNVPYNDTDDFNAILQKHHKEILVSILKIRLELIKLLTDDYTILETRITNLSIENDELFLSEFQIVTTHIAHMTDTHLTQHNLSLSTDFLDQIELDCLAQLSDDNTNSEGKRPPTRDINNTTRCTRPKV